MAATPDPTPRENPSRGSGSAPLLDSYHPVGAGLVTTGDGYTVPICAAGTAELPRGDWAKKLWELPWKVAWKVTAQGKKLKGSLPGKCIEKSPVRDLMARLGFFWSGRRQEE